LAGTGLPGYQGVADIADMPVEAIWRPTTGPEQCNRWSPMAALWTAREVMEWRHRAEVARGNDPRPDPQASIAGKHGEICRFQRGALPRDNRPAVGQVTPGRRGNI